MKRRTKRDLIDAALAGFVIICIVLAGITVHMTKHHARDASVMLQGVHGQCSGVQVRVKSGAEYILSAGHCSHLGVGDEMTVTTEDGRKLTRKVIQEDPNSDLLLIEGVPGGRSIKIADSVSVGDKVDTFTHGSGLATHKTSGELIEYKDIDVPLYMLDTVEAATECKSMPKNRLQSFEIFGIQIGVCSMHLAGVVSTASVVPGSSGGMVVRGDEVVGIVSATDGHFGYFVSLKDIKNFTDNY